MILHSGGAPIVLKFSSKLNFNNLGQLLAILVTCSSNVVCHILLSKFTNDFKNRDSISKSANVIMI